MNIIIIPYSQRQTKERSKMMKCNVSIEVKILQSDDYRKKFSFSGILLFVVIVCVFIRVSNGPRTSSF